MEKILHVTCFNIDNINSHIYKNNNPLEIKYVDSKETNKHNKLINKHLSEKEIDRAKRFIRPVDSTCYSLTHALLRHLLSKSININPLQIEIHSIENHKPYITSRELDFNISHSDHYGCVVIADHTELKTGIDIEKIKNLDDMMNLIQTYMSKQEQEYINSGKTRDEQLKRFYVIWTRKEALLKMIGTGLVDNLCDVSVILGENVVSIVPYEDIVIKTDHVFIYTYIDFDFVLSIALNKPRIINISEFNGFY